MKPETPLKVPNNEVLPQPVIHKEPELAIQEPEVKAVDEI